MKELKPHWKTVAVPHYAKAHAWIKKFGSPQLCYHCGTTEKRRYGWANVSQEYKMELDDWMRLCDPCHRFYDQGFIEVCKYGHKIGGENTFTNSRGTIGCRTCKRQNHRDWKRKKGVSRLQDALKLSPKQYSGYVAWRVKSGSRVLNWSTEPNQSFILKFYGVPCLVDCHSGVFTVTKLKEQPHE